MFRRLPRPRTKPSARPTWTPSLAGRGPGGGRGIKSGELARIRPNWQAIKIPNSVYHGPITIHGREFLEKLAARGIVLDRDLKSVPSLTAHSMTFRMCPQHFVSFGDLRYFTIKGHPLAEAVFRRCAGEHDEKPLWVDASTRGADKSIVRSKATYRMGAALKQALRNNGYDARGWRLPEETWRGHCRLLGFDADRLEPRRRRIAQLHGGVEIVAADARAIHRVSFATLRDHFEEVVRGFEEVMGRDEKGALVFTMGGIRKGGPRLVT